MTLEEIKALQELNLSVEGYHRLMMYLMIANREEAERIKAAPRIVLEVNAIAEYLNERKRLPEKYKHLVKNYRGFEGVDLESEKFCF